ncbi:MAG TPA: pitrilysin family protein [Longilinea sp.]|nr:pitrilysin family protein [Longilinea sp.]
MADEIFSTVLDNGLKVSLKEIHTAPIISQWIWYRVGSRDEEDGCRGISHWVEHMQFKGTPTFPAAVLDKAISREGGWWNAFTNTDWTTYMEAMPANAIDLPLRLEADRMVNSVYKEDEVNSERTVVVSELEGSENDPMYRLSQSVQAASFDTHPYHYEVIGTKDDLMRIGRDDLYQYYRRHYIPNNAILTLAGDFETNKMLDRVKRLYNDIPAGKLPEHPAKPEPPLRSERRVDLQGAGDTTFIMVTYRAPKGNDDDFLAFSVLDSLLSGPAGLNIFGGGGISNKTSRLYRALVEKEYAIAVGGGLQATIDPSLYDLTITVNPRRKVKEVIKVLDTEIDRVIQNAVNPTEVARAIKQARAQFAYGSENITNQAFWLGYAEMFANYDWFLHYMIRLEQVTPADVQRIAQQYLIPSRRVIGVYTPTGEEVSA